MMQRLAQSLLDPFAQVLVRRLLAGPLAIWGKLPSHADYAQHRNSPAQAHDWQDWVARHWPSAAMPRDTGRLPVAARRSVVPLCTLPVGFVIQRGVLPFSPRHCVQGVMLASCDQIGRPCPLIVYQQISRRWLLRTWGGKGLPPAHGLLFWLARILARLQAGDGSWSALRQAVDRAGQLYAPQPGHLLRALPPAPLSAQLQSLLSNYCASEEADPAWGQRARQSRPFSHWPAYSLHAQQPSHSFWQQDLQGAFISSGQNLATLWGLRT